MSEILDDDLATRKRPKSLYGKYSNLPAAVVILGALFKIMHWPYGDIMLLFGISFHFGIELGYALIFRFKHNINNRRLIIATFFLIVLSGLWRFDFEFWTMLDYSFLLVIIGSAVATYVIVRQKIKGLNKP